MDLVKIFDFGIVTLLHQSGSRSDICWSLANFSERDRKQIHEIVSVAFVSFESNA